MSVFFNGRRYVSPTTASAVDDSAMYGRGASVANVLAIVGKAEGGEPFTALRFGSPSQAAAVLRSGEGLDAVRKAFDPSAETGGPAEVIFIRVNPATRSSLSLLDSVGDASITLQSQGYGAFTKNIRIKVETGSVKGKKVTTNLGNGYLAQDNLYREAFSVRYAGSASAVTATVTGSAFTVTVDGTPTAIDLALYPTVGALVDRLNAITGLTATVLDGNTEKPALAGLDAVTGQDIKTATYTVTAHLQAIIDWLNSAAEPYITATRAGSKTPANIPYTYLAGGSDGSVTTAEWQQAFDALQRIDAQWVVPVSPLAAIHAMADTHCQFMSTVGRRERRAICGTASATDDAAAAPLAKALNSDRTSLAHIGYYDYNAAGALVLFEPYLLAALIGGMAAAVSPGTPLTNKTIKVRGLERELRNPTDTDPLIEAGVLCVENTEDGYKIVQSITTWLANDNYNRVEMSTGAALDYAVRTVRKALDSLRGQGASPLLLFKAEAVTDTTLRGLAVPAPMGPGVLVGDDTNPPFKDIRVSIDGDALRAEFQCSPVIPANYVLVTVHAVPYSGSVSA